MTKTDAQDPRPQPDKFRDLARELECDEDEAAFKENLQKVAVTTTEATAHKRALTRWENEGGAKKSGRKPKDDLS